LWLIADGRQLLSLHTKNDKTAIIIPQRLIREIVCAAHINEAGLLQQGQGLGRRVSAQSRRDVHSIDIDPFAEVI